jgi:hypothetical protein
VIPLLSRQWPSNRWLATSSIAWSRNQSHTPKKNNKRKNDTKLIARQSPISSTTRQQKQIRKSKNNNIYECKDGSKSVNHWLSISIRQQKQIRIPKNNDNDKDVTIPFNRTKHQQPNYFKDPYLLADKLNRLYKSDKLEEALELLKEAPIKAQSPVVWNELIQAYGRVGQRKNAWYAYNQVNTTI